MHAGNGVQTADEKVAALLICAAHRFDLLAAFEGHRRGFLDEAARAGNRVLKQLRRHLDDLGRGRHVADAPPRHGDAFGKAVDRDDARRNVGVGGRADVFVSVEEDLLVHLVGQQDDVGVAEHEAAQDFRLGARQHPAGGIVGIVDDEQARFARDFLFQSLFGYAVAFVGIEGNRHGNGRGRLRDGRIRHPARRQVHHFVAGIHQRAHGGVNGVLAARRDDHAVGVIAGAAVLGAELGSDLFAQLRQAVAHGVVRIAGVDLTEQFVADLPGRVEIRFASGQVHDLRIHGFQPFRFGHGHHRRRRNDRSDLSVQIQRHGQFLLLYMIPMFLFIFLHGIIG